jgi:hypothetical protein
LETRLVGNVRDGIAECGSRFGENGALKPTATIKKMIDPSLRRFNPYWRIGARRAKDAWLSERRDPQLAI